MLFLNKLLPIFVLPLGFALLLLALALVLRKRWPAVAAAAVLYGSSIPAVGDRLIGWLETRYPAVPVARVEKADAIVVLGGIFGPQVKPGFLANVAESGERLEAGIVLYQTGAAPWLVFTGGRIPWEGRDKVEGEDSRAAAIARGVPAEKILITREVGNTADEARAVRDLLRAHNLKRVILVTTGWHMPRAAWLFRHAGVDCVIFPVDFRRDPARPLTLLDFLPNAGALHDTETALREAYGNLFYRIFR
ncbi:MAG: YdcF family protein [Opitutae bacterium]|nr:YdcF family protein [Opitutae bacterium]